MLGSAWVSNALYPITIFFFYNRSNKDVLKLCIYGSNNNFLVHLIAFNISLHYNEFSFNCKNMQLSVQKHNIKQIFHVLVCFILMLF